MSETKTQRRFAPLEHVADMDAFRAEVRGWLEQTLSTNDWRARMAGASEAEYRVFQEWWLAQLSAVGLATSHWHKEWGGPGLSLRHQITISEEMSRIDAPRPTFYSVALNHVPATLFAYGTQAQRDRYIPGVRDQGVIWCQGFSEPGAGSDLASLRTRAERRGDVYVINGQKIWSSTASHAKYCLLLARTDPDVKKHAGISFFIMDMESKGLTKRPIMQATGQAEFCELFLDDVEIPVENLVGPENEGWKVAQATLSAERGLFIFDLSARLLKAMGQELADAQAGKHAWYQDSEARREFMTYYAEAFGLRGVVMGMFEELEANPTMGASNVPLYVKLTYSTLLQRFTDFHIRAKGLEAQILTPFVLGGGSLTVNDFMDFLYSYAWTISGGTNEVIRNIISERALGLPR